MSSFFKSYGLAFIVIGSLALLLSLVIGSQYYFYGRSTELCNVTVTDKTVKHVSGTADRSGYDQYLIFLSHPDWEQDRVMKVEDSFWWWCFDSSDRYANLKIGSSYCLTWIGVRSNFFSWYPNIVAYDRTEAEVVPASSSGSSN